MKTTYRSLLISAVLLFLAGAAAQAHGLHPEVEPQFHVVAHLLVLIGVVGLAVAVGLCARRRARRLQKTQ